MKEFGRFLPPILDPAPLVGTSRIRIGKRVRIEGVPAILLGVAAIVAAAGVSRALPTLPDILRETKLLIDSARAARKPLQS